MVAYYTSDTKHIVRLHALPPKSCVINLQKYQKVRHFRIMGPVCLCLLRLPSAMDPNILRLYLFAPYALRSIRSAPAENHIGLDIRHTHIHTHTENWAEQSTVSRSINLEINLFLIVSIWVLSLIRQALSSPPPSSPIQNLPLKSNGISLTCPSVRWLLLAACVPHWFYR